MHWANSPLRPELAESTYLLYRATGDPYYLDVGKIILEALNRSARVPCGFASIKDIRTWEREDQMVLFVMFSSCLYFRLFCFNVYLQDSFVLAETFKYLYLLFADPADIPFNLDEYVFTTEAHPLPVALGLRPPPPGKFKLGIKPQPTLGTCPNPRQALLRRFLQHVCADSARAVHTPRCGRTS